MNTYLGIDLGTTRIKAGLFDERGEHLALATRDAPPFQSDEGRREFSLEDYWNAFRDALNEAMEAAPGIASIAAVGFSSQAQTFTAFDADGEPLHPMISWLDDRARDAAGEIRSAVGTEEFYRLSGFNAVTPLSLAPKLLWLSRNEPDVFTRADRFALLRDYFIRKLTGSWVSDPTLMALGGVYDRFQGTYWGRMLDLIGLEEDRLPGLVPSGGVCGRVTEEASQGTGIPAGTPVVPGCLDQIASAVGVGNLEPGSVSVNVGTVITVFLTREEQEVDPKGRMLAGSHVLPERYFLMPYIQAGGMAVDWLRNTLAPESGYTTLEEEARTVSPGADGLVFIPHLSGCFSPEVHPEARGHFCGLTLSHRRGHLYRAVLEGVAFALRENLELLEEFGADAKSMSLFGGGSGSDLWTSIIADVTGRIVHRPREREASCLGAAILAAAGSGSPGSLEGVARRWVQKADAVEPDGDLPVVYDEVYRRFLEIEKRTFPRKDS